MKQEPEKKKRVRIPAKKEHYVNNKEFLEAMIEYKIKSDKAKARNRKPQQILAECEKISG